MNQWAGRKNGGNNFWRAEYSKKNEKSWEQSQRPLGPYQMHQHSNYRGPRRRREKERVWENFEEIIVENFPNMEKEIVKSRGAKSPIQDKPKEKHTKTHTNQTNKD